jgi:hypothetical protein
MLDHLIGPDIPTKRQELEHDIEECKELEAKLHALEPDPDYLRE